MSLSGGRPVGEEGQSFAIISTGTHRMVAPTHVPDVLHVTVKARNVFAWLTGRQAALSTDMGNEWEPIHVSTEARKALHLPNEQPGETFAQQFVRTLQEMETKKIQPLIHQVPFSMSGQNNPARAQRGLENLERPREQRDSFIITADEKDRIESFGIRWPAMYQPNQSGTYTLTAESREEFWKHLIAANKGRLLQVPQNATPEELIFVGEYLRRATARTTSSLPPVPGNLFPRYAEAWEEPKPQSIQNAWKNMQFLSEIELPARRASVATRLNAGLSLTGESPLENYHPGSQDGHNMKLLTQALRLRNTSEPHREEALWNNLREIFRDVEVAKRLSFLEYVGRTLPNVLEDPVIAGRLKGIIDDLASTLMRENVGVSVVRNAMEANPLLQALVRQLEQLTSSPATPSSGAPSGKSLGTRLWGAMGGATRGLGGIVGGVAKGAMAWLATPSTGGEASSSSQFPGALPQVSLPSTPASEQKPKPSRSLYPSLEDLPSHPPSASVLSSPPPPPPPPSLSKPTVSPSVTPSPARPEPRPAPPSSSSGVPTPSRSLPPPPPPSLPPPSLNVRPEPRPVSPAPPELPETEPAEPNAQKVRTIVDRLAVQGRPENLLKIIKDSLREGNSVLYLRGKHPVTWEENKHALLAILGSDVRGQRGVAANLKKYVAEIIQSLPPAQMQDFIRAAKEKGFEIV